MQKDHRMEEKLKKSDSILKTVKEENDWAVNGLRKISERLVDKFKLKNDHILNEFKEENNRILKEFKEKNDHQLSVFKEKHYQNLHEFVTPHKLFQMRKTDSILNEIKKKDQLLNEVWKNNPTWNEFRKDFLVSLATRKPVTVYYTPGKFHIEGVSYRGVNPFEETQSKLQMFYHFGESFQISLEHDFYQNSVGVFFTILG